MGSWVLARVLVGSWVLVVGGGDVGVELGIGGGFGGECLVGNVLWHAG